MKKICIKFTITECSSLEKRWSEAHFVPFLFCYYCSVSWVMEFLTCAYKIRLILSKAFKENKNRCRKRCFPFLMENFLVGHSDLESLSFVKLRFITMILTLYSSFARFEKNIKLTLSDVVREVLGFVLTFQKGKSA